MGGSCLRVLSELNQNPRSSVATAHSPPPASGTSSRAPAPPHRPRPAPRSPRAPPPRHRPIDFDRPRPAPRPSHASPAGPPRSPRGSVATTSLPKFVSILTRVRTRDTEPASAPTVHDDSPPYPAGPTGTPRSTCDTAATTSVTDAPSDHRPAYPRTPPAAPRHPPSHQLRPSPSSPSAPRPPSHGAVHPVTPHIVPDVPDLPRFPSLHTYITSRHRLYIHCRRP